MILLFRLMLRTSAVLRGSVGLEFALFLRPLRKMLKTLISTTHHHILYGINVVASYLSPQVANIAQSLLFPVRRYLTSIKSSRPVHMLNGIQSLTPLELDYLG